MKKWLKIVIDVIAWMLIVFSACLTIIVFTSKNDVGVPNIFGNMIFTIQTDSMDPTIKVGDLILVKKIEGSYSEEANLKVGDVITYWTTIQGQRVANTHRVVAVNVLANGSVTVNTKGDKPGSIQDAGEVLQSDIIGKYTEKRVGGLGAVLDYLRTSAGFFVCVILPLILFFLYELFIFIKTMNERNKEKATVEFSEKEEDIKRRAIEEYLAKQNSEKSADAADKGTEDTDKKDGE